MHMRPRLLFLIMFLALVLAPPAGYAKKTAPRVLIVHSYNAEYIWCGQINQGINESLQGTGATIDIVYMDAKRTPEPEKLRHGAATVLQHIEQWRPQVVITVDDVAQQYLVAPYLNGPDSPQVIFCGVNAPLKKYGFPTANVSGVRERWHFRDGFSLLKRIAPQVKTIAFLVEDSESGGYVLDDLQTERRSTSPLPLRVTMAEKVRTFQQWQKLVLRAQKSVDALALGLYNALVDEKTGTVVPPEKVMAWTNSINTKPTVGFSDVAKQHGLLCGVLESGHEQGYLAGNMAREVLSGATAGALPVRINVKGLVFVNLRTAKRLRVHVPYAIIQAAGEVSQ